MYKQNKQRFVITYILTNLIYVIMIDKRIKTPYFIDYVVQDVYREECYYRLIRNSDGSILYLNKTLNNILAYCWSVGINKEHVTIL